MSDGAELIVLGGGPAGLAAAWRAARSGRSVVLLERAAAVGGMAASLDVADIRVDHGSHRLHPSTRPDIMADLAALLGDDLQRRPRNGRLHITRRWVGFPLRPTELARTLPKSLLARIGRDTLTGSLRGYDVPASYAESLRASLGPALYDELYGPFAVKLWGVPGEQIDPEQARRRVSADTPWKIAARMLRRGSGPGRVFYYPRRGFGQIVDRLADGAVDAGARIRLGAEVTSIRPGSDGVRVRTADGAELAGGRLFTTIPLPHLARLADPAAPTAAVDAAAGLGFRSMVLLYLMHDGKPWTTFDAHYVPGAESPITRISEPANYRDSRDDPADRTVLCCEIPCATGDEWWQASEAELTELAVDTLRRLGLPPLRLSGVEVRRLRNVYPVYRIGFQTALRGLDDWVDTLPGVTTFGRLGLFVHDNTHHAMAMAYDAVDALGSDGAFDDVAWARARERFADHVVED